MTLFISKEKFKRKIRRAAAAIAALALAVSITFPAGTDIMGVSFGNAVVASARTVDSGTCGAHLTWTLDDNGTLTISGSGAMYDWNSSRAIPHNSLKNRKKNGKIGKAHILYLNIRKIFRLYKLVGIRLRLVGKKLTEIGYECAFCSWKFPRSISAVGITPISFLWLWYRQGSG